MDGRDRKFLGALLVGGIVYGVATFVDIKAALALGVFLILFRIELLSLERK